MSSDPFGRRTFLRGTALAAAAPAVLAISPTGVASAERFTPFVDAYRTNNTDNLTPESNAAVRALSGMSELWRTGTEWDNGTALAPKVLRENIRYTERTTRRRTVDEAKQSFIDDRRHKSYSMIRGLGPLAEAYREGAQAVTSIVDAPDGTPPGKISDTLPDDAPVGSALGAGSESSELGPVALLVNTVRGPHSSSNPSKYSFNYPRPWRLNDRNEVVDTGRVDEFGFPVYDSKVVVAPQLLRQRGDDPSGDGGFPSGHTNAGWLAAFAYAYALPERYQELMVAAADLGHTRIVAGMHSPISVVGGRVLATALAAAILADPVNAEIKAAARERAVDYFTTVTGNDDLYEAAHTGDDPYGDREENRRRTMPRMTYLSPVDRHDDSSMRAPEGSESLLETRFPYLSGRDRRAVLESTALPAGYPLLDGPEQWGRLDLFTAADGFGELVRPMRVVMDSAQRGFHARDTWRNDIGGRGGLTKAGSGTLVLRGANSYRGGTRVEGGTLVAASRSALGSGDLYVAPGVSLGATLGTTVEVDGAARIGRGAALDVTAPEQRLGGHHTVLRARHVTGEFAEVRVNGRRVEAEHTKHAVTIRL
ncbi:autotransporter-associated beta strand repeat-containing protein [Prauserella aidingensis]|uniref:phosphatase PAP2 family protein n=1 Tax=Prauserella aidingensis TaxID=387890 RepID=UPI002646EEC8|nr:phosphatase PAP2 family protein [Prauserella aidingensis]MCP2255475.1 autotransporter-associated beta strand repeat-containing protein [Prauserella aidingensis]